MNEPITKEIIDKIFANVFGCVNPFTNEEIFARFAYDLKLPQKVKDSTTGESTWAAAINPTKLMTTKNSFKIDTWMQSRVDINGIEDIIKIWQKINYTNTERNYESENVIESDTVYQSENVVRSANCFRNKNIVFCDGCSHSEYLLASQVSSSCQYSIKMDDADNCTNCYNVTTSSHISNSLFIIDSSNLDECIFCAHISNKKFCIANMQFAEAEYYAMKKEIIQWLLNK